jgi:hypothetical protein
MPISGAYEAEALNLAEGPYDPAPRFWMHRQQVDDVRPALAVLIG